MEENGGAEEKVAIAIISSNDSEPEKEFPVVSDGGGASDTRVSLS